MKKGISVLLIIISIVSLGFYFKSLLPEEKEEITVTIKNTDNTIEKKELNEYLIGVVACEMPASFPEEALKAQAIASRTYALYKAQSNLSLVTTTDDQCFINEEEMKIKWGSDFNKYYNIVKNAVINTLDIVIKKDNKLFKTFYFSTSNGYTEDSLTVFNEVGLTGVESLWDIDSSNYKREKVMTKEELISILGNFNNITINERNNTNHILKVSVDNKTYTGVEFRKLLGLRSTDFEIKIDNNNYIFTTYGYGHGVGMSQYGASYLAKTGKSYKEILEYYYGNIEFTKI